MKIAVVGTGVAGLAAAWRLSTVHDLVVYEAQAQPGGHVWTVDVPAEQHTPVSSPDSIPIDVGFQLYHERFCPNVRALLEILGVSTEAVSFSLSSSVGPDTWTNNGQRTRLSEVIAGDIGRFLRDVPMMAQLPPELTLRDFFEVRSYSADFRYKCLGPILSFWWVTRTALFEIPAFAVAAGILQGAVSFGTPTEYRAVRGGARTYVERLITTFEDRMTCSTPVTRVERHRGGVVVHDARCRQSTFDQVVLATDAATALALLTPPSAEEQRLLGNARFEDSTLIVHRDEQVMPADRRLWSYGNYRTSSAQEGDADLAGEMTYWQPRPGRPSMFVTVASAKTNLDQSKIIAERSWRHRVIDAGVFRDRISTIQGADRIWFCGGHMVGLPVHEHALCSGLAVAEALGGEYPFSSNRDASKFYEMFKSSFM